MIIHFFHFNKYGQESITFLQYFGLISAIPCTWVREFRNTRSILEDYQFPYESFSGKVTALVYGKLISNKKALIVVFEKWKQKLNLGAIVCYEEFLEHFEHLYKLSPSTKLRNFQYRFLHRVIFLC